MSALRDDHVTLKHVAEEAGVSVSTVSRVVRGEPYISEETRACVLAAMERLQYRPSRIARSLKRGQEGTGNICLLINEPRRRVSEPFFTELLAGVTDAAVEAHYDVLISTKYTEASASEALDALLHAQLSDGVIFLGRVIDQELVDIFRRYRMPFVLFGYDKASAGACVQLGPDDYGGVRLLTEHLLSHGHRRMALVAAQPRQFTTRDRVHGFTDVMHEHGLTVEPGWVRYGDYTHEHGYESTFALFQQRQDAPTAVVAGSDVIAFGVIEALGELGLRVPEDVAVVGFDDIAQARWSQPPLTTIRQPIRQEGYLLVTKLLDLIAGQADVPSTLIPVELVIRRSCGCP